jgi:Pectin methylesterase
MKRIVGFPIIVFTCMFFSRVLAGEKANIIVAQDGSGQFKSIQDALNSVPPDNNRNIIILIRKGVYHEKLYITKSYVTLVGEDRDSTRIVYAELRKNWNSEHNGSDWGSAVVNIDSLVTNLTLANVTVYNNYGSLYGSHDHQFAVRGGGTRVIILNCNIIADGGDTLSLWNRQEGMYYHTNCYFEGWVDFVCPRGWCYITDSKFYGHNLSASIWHDGSTKKDQKFVIRYSNFDGVPDFPLGRHHRDGQIFLLDCIFSRSMTDRPIYYPSSPTSVPWKWGERHYYYNCHREGGDFDWFKDNLETAAAAPKQNDITAQWTFDGKWDPEETMPAVLPMVFLPRPRDGTYKAATEGTVLQWIPARNAISHNIYFGKSTKPELRRNQQGNIFDPGKLETKTRYYWQIDEVTEVDTIKGELWHFTTQ